MDGSKTKHRRRISDYFINFVQFHKIREEKLAIFVFLFMLLIVTFQRKELFELASKFIVGMKGVNDEGIKNNSYYLGVIIATNVIINIISSIYLIAYIKDLKKEYYTMKEIFKLYFKKLPKLIIVEIIFSIMIYIGFFLVPVNTVKLLTLVIALYFYIIYIFHRCIVLDKDTSIWRVFTESVKLTDKNKKAILYPLILIITLYSFVASLFGDTVLLVVSSFGYTIVTLMKERYIGLLYMDLQYDYYNTELEKEEKAINKIK